MKYDATHKTTLDAWHEFKDKCNNEALVIMPVQTGELREFAIKNNLFVLNLNKKARRSPKWSKCGSTGRSALLGYSRMSRSMGGNRE